MRLALTALCVTDLIPLFGFQGFGSRTGPRSRAGHGGSLSVNSRTAIKIFIHWLFARVSLAKRRAILPPDVLRDSLHVQVSKKSKVSVFVTFVLSCLWVCVYIYAQFFFLTVQIDLHYFVFDIYLLCCGLLYIFLLFLPNTNRNHL